MFGCSGSSRRFCLSMEYITLGHMERLQEPLLDWLNGLFSFSHCAESAVVKSTMCTMYNFNEFSSWGAFKCSCWKLCFCIRHRLDVTVFMIIQTQPHPFCCFCGPVLVVNLTLYNVFLEEWIIIIGCAC